MPHATENSAALINGEKQNSKFLSHLESYPVVSDSIEGFKQNAYGRKSIDLADSTYQRFGKPVEPYLETPYSYAKPYVTKADELADSGLDRVDAHFPIVKEDTRTIIDTGKSYIFWPFKVANDGKDYVLKTWQGEYEKTAKYKNRGPGLTTSGLAIISTELKIASDFFQQVADFLGPKYEEGKSKASELLNDAASTVDQYKAVGQEKLQEAQQAGQKKANETEKKASETAEQTKQEAKKAKEDVKQNVNAK